MKEIDDLVTEMLVIVFAAGMLVVANLRANLYVENRAQTLPPIPAVKMVAIQTSSIRQPAPRAPQN